MTNDLTFTDATKLAELIRSQEISPVELMKAHLDKIEALNPVLNAFVTMNENAIKEAKIAEAAVMAGDKLAALHGVPFSVKDSIDTAGLKTQRGSPIFKDRTPDADATSVARLKKAGAIVLGKTNLRDSITGLKAIIYYLDEQTIPGT